MKACLKTIELEKMILLEYVSLLVEELFVFDPRPYQVPASGICPLYKEIDA